MKSAVLEALDKIVAYVAMTDPGSDTFVLEDVT